MSINRVMLTGHLTRDPELKQTNSGSAILSLSVAVEDRRFNRQSQSSETYTNFINCTLFGKRAQSVAQYLHKGSKIAIEGKLHYSSWESNGQRRSKVDVTVDEIEFMDARQAPKQQSQPQQYQQQQYQQPAQQVQYQQPQAVQQPVQQQMPQQQMMPQQQQFQASTAEPENFYDADIPF